MSNQLELKISGFQGVVVLSATFPNMGGTLFS